jgi:branched-chain amino acid transport system substrate-binding protein
MIRVATISLAALMGLAAGLDSARADSIKIGVIQPLTGSVAYNGQSVVNGAKLAIQAINAAGGVNGSTLELVIEDGECKPASSVNAAEKLIQKDKVPIILGAFCSSATLAVMPVAEKYQVPLITGVSSNATLTEKGNKWFFRATDTDAILAKSFARILYDKLKLRSLALVGVNDDFGRGAVDEFVKNMEALGGKVVLKDYFDHGTTDYYTLLTKVRAAKPDGLFVAAETQDGSILVKQVKELGLDLKVFGVGSWATSDFIKLAGEAAEGIYAAVPYAYTMENPKNQAFVKEYQAAFKEAPGKYQAAGNNVANIIAQAIKRAGSSEPAKLRDALTQTDYDGVNGNFKFDSKNQAYGFDLVLVRLEKGVPTVVASAPTEKTN